MLCEKCGYEITEHVTCRACGKEVVKLGPFCYLCGASHTANAEGAEESGAVDFSDRILCSDGACIGVVENGVCKLCGKPYTPEA